MLAERSPPDAGSTRASAPCAGGSPDCSPYMQSTLICMRSFWWRVFAICFVYQSHASLSMDDRRLSTQALT